MVLGTVKDFSNEAAARKALAGLLREINATDRRVCLRPITMQELAAHYRQHELKESNWKSYSTRYAYEGYLRKWIVPRWGTYSLDAVRAVEIEAWLQQLGRARGTCIKIRNLMSVLFNHASRHDLFDRNPASLVRQSGKRRSIPSVFAVEELQRLLATLDNKLRVMALLAIGTGLRCSELFALKWKDIDFDGKQISVLRSIVRGRIGICKTESSQKPVPLDDRLAEALGEWRCRCSYRHPEDWVFASPVAKGKKPYWPAMLMRKHIKPVARKLGINKPMGWHTFRHTYSTLLKSTGADLKVTQELMRHASVVLTLDHYTQALTPAKRAAQSTVLSLLFP
jgi:integrase